MSSEPEAEDEHSRFLGGTSKPAIGITKLPVELIQRIFFECLEINFPRASPKIANALSHPLIYTWLIRLAFSSNNESSKYDFFVDSFLPLRYCLLDTRQRAALQTEILECRWCTLPLMRRCQREYVYHVLRQKCTTLDISPADRDQLANLDEFWDSMNRYDTSPSGRRGKGDLVISARDPVTDTSRKIAIWFNFGSVQIREPSPVFHEADVFRLPSCSFTDPCRVPDKLLCHPWTDDKLELLTLLSTEAYIDENNHFERSKMILRQVIQDRDIKTFTILLCMNIRVRVYGYPLRWPVRPNHFRVAARLAHPDEKDPFLWSLFSMRRDDVPVEDRAIRALMIKYDNWHS